MRATYKVHEFVIMGKTGGDLGAKPPEARGPNTTWWPSGFRSNEIWPRSACKAVTKKIQQESGGAPISPEARGLKSGKTLEGQ